VFSSSLTIPHSPHQVQVLPVARRPYRIGGPCYMNQCSQDAIAVACYYHGFDLFITFTCNSRWPEITNTLLPGQTAADFPDLIVRVLNMYKTMLVDELSKHHIFSHTDAYVYTIDFQRHGLPHMHLCEEPTNGPFRNLGAQGNVVRRRCGAGGRREEQSRTKR
jgi:hypothetical protein